MTKLEKACFAGVVAIVCCIGAAIVGTYGTGGSDSTQIGAGLLSLAGISVTNLLGSIKSSQALDLIKEISQRLDDHITAVTNSEPTPSVQKAVKTAVNDLVATVAQSAVDATAAEDLTVIDTNEKPAAILPDLTAVGGSNASYLPNSQQLESE